jgi:hypothetical protein
MSAGSGTMTVLHAMTQADRSFVEDDDQTLTELIEATIELARMTFAYPLSFITHLQDEFAPAAVPTKSG